MLCEFVTTTTTTNRVREGLIPGPELLLLQARSNAPGVRRLLGHLLAIFATGSLYALALARGESVLVEAVAMVTYGFTLVTMFAAMHETVHRTAFKSRRLNDAVSFFAGLLSFYNSSFYRPYHGFHHRFTQIPGKDPELDDKRPTSFGAYLLELSGLPWWIGKVRTYFKLARGKTESYPFLNDQNAALVVRSVRLQCSVYVAAQALSLWLGRPYFVLFWLLPVAAAQPLLRAILLAEHGGCTENDDGLSNTRTTHTVWPVRFLMWEMPYHAEHHLYPALPFFALAQAHDRVGPRLRYLARGYWGFNVRYIKAMSKRAMPKQAA